MARLGDICNLITDGSHFSPQACDKGYPMMSVKDMEENDFSFETCKYISESDYRILVNNGCRPQTNDVLLAKDGSYFKYAFVVKEDRELTLLSSIAILRPKTQCVDPNYLRWFLMAESTYRTVSLNYITGTALKRVILQGIKKIEISLPALEEQQKIALQLEKVSDLIALRKQQLAKLDELVKSRFVEMFGDPESNPMGWPIKKLDAVVSSITAGWSANGEARLKKAGEKAVLKVSAVTQGFFKPDEHKVIPADMEIKKYVYPQKGDLLFSRANTRELVGATAIIEQDYPELLLPDKLWKVLFTNEMDVYYAKHILSTQAIRKVFSSQSTGTSGSMFNVSAEKFRETSIPVPPIMLQHAFASFVQQTDKSKLEIQTALTKLETLKKALMQQYFG